MLTTPRNQPAGTPATASRWWVRCAAAAALFACGWAFAQGNSPAAGAGTPTAEPTAAAAPFAAGRIIVMPRAGLPDAAFGKLLRDNGAGRWQKLGRSPLRLVEMPPGLERVMAARLARHPHIKFAELDQRVAPSAASNDPYFGSAWHLAKINASTAWDSSTGNGITIAILDTGVDGTHPDLASRMVAGYNFYDGNTNASDVQGHGTAVAGAAAATLNNGVGVAGLAGGARIMPVRISDPTGYAWWSTVAQGVYWAADNGARVANISYGGVSGSFSVQGAAEYMRGKGGLVIAAAGNNNRDENIAPTTTMITVSATQETDLRASFSSWGNFVTVAAPGTNIWTTSRGGIYQQWWGTSFASPVTAGVVALMMSRAPSLTAAQIESLLYSSALDLGTAGRDPIFGFGRVDAAAAVAAAGAAAAPPDTQAPTASITAPAASSTVSGIVAVNLNATDNTGVTRVELRVNGSTVATDTSSPYGFSWDSTTVANGMAGLVVVAFDAAGNSTASAAVSVNVANADTTLPTVSITSPGAGATVAGVVPVGVTAADNIGVTRVELRVNGTTVATDTNSPYAFSWDSATLANGSASLVAVAFDAAGNNRASTAVSVTVANADITLPTVSITSPGAGATVSGVVPVSVTAADNIGVTRVELRINGTTVATDTTAPYAFNWDSATLANGAASLVAVAFDAAGNNRASTAVSVTVSNADITLPTVSITSPGAGASVSGVVPISVTAADNIGVSRVDLRINGTTVATDTAAPFAFNWDSTTLANGAASLVAVAVDAAGNSQASAAVAVTVANADTQQPSVSISSPGASASVSGIVPVSVTAADNVGVTRVELQINGTAVATDTAAPFAFNWDSTTLANGAASLVAVAFDAAGNSRASTAVSVTIANADITLPTVSITSPGVGASVSGVVPISVTAADNIGVTRVEFQVNGTTVATDTAAPFAFNWDSTTVANGAASLVAVAFDAAGNNRASTAVSVTIANADVTLPTVSITSPGAGASVSGIVPISVTAADNIGVTRVELRINGTTVATDTAAPFAFNWDSTTLANGAASLVAVAFDAAGNNRASTAVSVTIANADITLPTVSITSPGVGASVSGVVPVSVTAADNIGVTRVELRVNGTTVATDTAAPFAFNWDSSTLANGGASLVAIAFDAAGNNRASTAVSVTIANADVTLPTVSITSPGVGASVSGVVPIGVTAADNVGVTRVELRVNGTTVATDTVAPFAFNWDSTTLANGAASLVAVAFDAAGNNRASTAVSVTIANADITLPTVSITSPGAGASVSGVVPISVTAADNVGVTRVELRVNGTTVATDTAAPFAFNWDSTTLANGAASLVAVAFDAAGNSRASTAVSVTVANGPPPDTLAPVITFTNPANGSTVTGVVSIRITASDDRPSTGIGQSLYINDRLVASSTGGTLSYNWNARRLAAGSTHSLRTEAWDAAGNRSTITVTVRR